MLLSSLRVLIIHVSRNKCTRKKTKKKFSCLSRVGTTWMMSFPVPDFQNYAKYCSSWHFTTMTIRLCLEHSLTKKFTVRNCYPSLSRSSSTKVASKIAVHAGPPCDQYENRFVNGAAWVKFKTFIALQPKVDYSADFSDTGISGSSNRILYTDCPIYFQPPSLLVEIQYLSFSFTTLRLLLSIFFGLSFVRE